MLRLLGILALILTFSAGSDPAFAQDEPNPRAATGGAQTLEDILARQRGEKVPSRERDGAAGQAAAMVGQLAPLGSASDSDVWSALRYNNADVTVSAGGEVAEVLVQDTGMRWYEFRQGPLREYGGYLLLGMIGALVLFYLIRGKIRIEGGRSGQTIERFGLIERCAHWLLAGSFILLGLTGLIVLFGRVAFIPMFGKEAFAGVAAASKWVHNWVAWPFMAALVVVFVLWVVHNIPNKHDVKWMLKGGGLFTSGSHPPAKKFNAGQKIIFWMVIILGVSVSATGLSMLMPFEYPMFAKTFEVVNALGLPGIVGMEPLPTELAPHAEMQLATVWHAVIAFVMMAVIIAHIYLGSIGMEGAFDAMGSGQVDLQWAKEHHGLWVEEVQEKTGAKAAATPAE